MLSLAQRVQRIIDGDPDDASHMLGATFHERLPGGQGPMPETRGWQLAEYGLFLGVAIGLARSDDPAETHWDVYQRVEPAAWEAWLSFNDGAGFDVARPAT
jgi:hypothetical protein